jgi:hypothetical protein
VPGTPLGPADDPVTAAEGRPARVGAAGLPAALTGGVVAATAALALGLAVRSLGWPLAHDAPLMHYVAARILEGAVPYRDLFDMNFPGVYLVHAAGLVLLGPGAGAFRALDLVWLAATAAGLAAALARFGGVAAVAGAALFALYHLAGGAWRAGQRDFLLCLPLAWATAAALADLARPRAATLALAALGLGAAPWLKPHALVLAPLALALAARRPAGHRAAAFAVAAAGLVAPAALALGWLGWAGGLSAFGDIVGGYLVPLYSGLGRASLVEAVRGHDLGVPVLAGLGAWALAGLLALGRPAWRDGRSAVLGAGLAYGAAHFVAQGKGWEYHLYPFALYAIALGAAGLGVARERGRPWPAVVLVTALAVSTGVLGWKGARNLDPAWVRAKVERAHAVAGVLAPLVAGGGTVQVLDTTDGGVHALYLLGVRQPTRFLYDFPFYHDVDHPYVRRLRAEALADLRRRPPVAVVLFERGWPAGGYERLAAFPGLAAWLETGYRLSHEGDGFRVYATRRHF